eukprot:2858124-Amphidinium_carterae.1
MTLPQYIENNPVVDNKVVLGSRCETWEKCKRVIQKEMKSFCGTAVETRHERTQSQKRNITDSLC